jgi:hypothetical protein
LFDKDIFFAGQTIGGAVIACQGELYLYLQGLVQSPHFEKSAHPMGRVPRQEEKASGAEVTQNKVGLSQLLGK